MCSSITLALLISSQIGISLLIVIINNNNIDFYLAHAHESISMRCTIQISTQIKNKKINIHAILFLS